MTGRASTPGALSATALPGVFGVCTLLEPVFRHPIRRTHNITERDIIRPMLIARSLTKVYPSGGQSLTVLREVSLEVEAGGFLAVVGPSGCGKTTLLGLLAGLDVPTAGSVILDGEDLGSLGEDERARLRGEKVGFG